MLLETHEALISANAWLMARLDALEVSPLLAPLGCGFLAKVTA